MADNSTKKKSAETAEKKKTTNTRSAKKAKRESFSTWEGHTLTSAEAKFIDEYCVTGNGRQSVLIAYPEQNPNSAAQRAQELLNKPYITSEINHRLQLAKNESIATASEIMNYFSAVMRGEIKDQFGLEASLSERTKAAVELAKRQIDIPQKLAGNEQPEIKITLDWARPTATVTDDDGNKPNESKSTPPTVREFLGDTFVKENIENYDGSGN